MILRNLSLVVISLTLAACNIFGSAQKGPFKTGSTVSLSKIDATASPIASSTINTQITNTQGRFFVGQIRWNGWCEVIVTGQYFNEFTNSDSSDALALNAITHKNRYFDRANVNLFTHLAAARIRNLVATGKNRSQAWRTTQNELKNVFGLKRVSNNINRGVEQLSLLRGSGNYRKDNANLLLFTGSFLANNGGATSLQALTDDFADDAQFNGVASDIFNRIAIAGSTPNLLNTLSTNLRQNGASNPPDNGDMRKLPKWVIEDSELDTTPPVITINGENPVTINLGSDYVDAGATATDNVDTTVEVSVTGSVDTSTVGSYALTYSATDSAGNTASVSRTVNVVDTTAPVITILGDNPVSVEVGSSYQDAGATATDNVDTTVEVSVTGSVDTDTVGSYALTYSATDSAGNTASVSRTVNVVDTTAPVITILGDNPVSVEAGSSYQDAGATATDNVDTTVEVSVTGSVDTGTVGSYTLTYSATDSAGNTASVSRTVNVVDTTAPVITILGDNPVSVEVGSSYQDAGATATDNVDTTVEVSVTGSVDTGTVGSYTLTYSATDSAGNTASASRTVNVVDTTAPVITVLGDNPVSVEVGSSYQDAGATATDNVDTTVEVSVTGSVDTGTVGSYTLTYSATDSAGNTASASRTVNVIAVVVATSNISGRVFEANGVAVAGISVEAFSNGEPLSTSTLITTDANGVFNAVFNADEELTLKLTKEGFATQVLPVKTPSINGKITLETIMLRRGLAQNLSGNSGGRATGSDGAAVNIDAESFIDANGDVVLEDILVTITPINVNTTAGNLAFPGAFAGVAEGDTEATTPIASYGTVEYTFSKATGEKVQLADGRTATIIIPIYQTQKQDGGTYVVNDVIALWSLDEATGIWKQEGTGVVISSPDSPTGLALEATVSHFTWWNCDVTINPAQAIITVTADAAGTALIKARTTGNIGSFRQNTADTVINIGETTRPLDVPSNGETCFWAELRFVNSATASTPQQCFTPTANETFNINLGISNEPLAIGAYPGNGVITGYLNTPVDIINIQPLTSETTVNYAITSGALPTGVTLNTVDSQRASLAGSATVAGSFTLEITATDAEGNTDAISISYNIIDAIAPPDLPSSVFISVERLGNTSIDLNRFNSGGGASQWVLKGEPQFECLSAPPEFLSLNLNTGILTATNPLRPFSWCGSVDAINTSGSDNMQIFVFTPPE